jgi:MFS family permease
MNQMPGASKPPGAELPPPPPYYRWSVLVVISLAMFGNYYVYDAISPIADLLKNQLAFSDKNIGLLNAIYSFPNIIMVLIGGIIIDRIGVRRASILFGTLCLGAPRSRRPRASSPSWLRAVSSSDSGPSR